MRIYTRLLWFFLIFCALGGGTYYWWWHQLASGVHQGIAAFVADQRQWGRTIAFSSVTITGFPGPLKVTLASPVVVAARGGPAPLTYWRWDGPTLYGDLNVFSPTRLTFYASGSHRLDSVVGREPYNIRMIIPDLRFILSVGNNGHLQSFDLTASNIKGSAVETGTDFTMKTLAARIDNTQPLLFSGHIDDFLANKELSPGFGHSLDRAIWSGKIFGELPLIGGAAAVDQWRQAGGRVEVEHFQAQASDLEVNLQGPLNLDEKLQFNAQFTGWVRGWNILLQNLVATGAMSPSGGALANLGLRALARPPDEGGAPAVHAPLTLANRRIFLGPVNLGTIPPIRWE